MLARSRRKFRETSLSKSQFFRLFGYNGHCFNLRKTMHVRTFVKLLSSLFFCLSASLAAVHPALEKELFTIRDPSCERRQFRSSMKKIGEYLALDVARDLNTHEVTMKTLLGKEAVHSLVLEEIVLVTILRAGLPLVDGFLEVFPDAEVGFFAMKRDEKSLKAKIDYIALPSLEGKTVILVDPMIATGGSMCDAILHMKQLHPKKILAAGAIATRDGMERIQKEMPGIRFYTGAVDPILNSIGYIVPGLGDAGDRSFGLKID
ncbi:MAG TPA: uracil phosphoribosyltransferase [Parachlamydiales bacterium]|nr:uracil phosphoribosyltransferase [Parachlamydiales bacterium]